MKMRLFSASGSRKSKYICTLGCLLCDRCGSLNRAIQGLTGPRYRPRCQDSDLKFQLHILEYRHARSPLPFIYHTSPLPSELLLLGSRVSSFSRILALGFCFPPVPLGIYLAPPLVSQAALGQKFFNHSCIGLDGPSEVRPILSS